MTEKEYKNYVILGKKELAQIEGHQKRICDYAMEVCTIRHGGKSPGIYTLKKYAEDIGMNPKTLQNWMQVYRNVIIKLEDPEKADFQKASKVNNILEENRTLDNAIGKTPGTRTAYKKDVPAEKVRSLYAKYEHEKPFEGEFINIMQQMKSFRNLFMKRDLNIIQDEHLQHCKDLLDECSQMLNTHLRNKRKNMGRTA